MIPQSGDLWAYDPTPDKPGSISVFFVLNEYHDDVHPGYRGSTLKIVFMDGPIAKDPRYNKLQIISSESIYVKQGHLVQRPK